MPVKYLSLRLYPVYQSLPQDNESSDEDDYNVNQPANPEELHDLQPSDYRFAEGFCYFLHRSLNKTFNAHPQMLRPEVLISFQPEGTRGAVLLSSNPEKTITHITPEEAVAWRKDKLGSAHTSSDYTLESPVPSLHNSGWWHRYTVPRPRSDSVPSRSGRKRKSRVHRLGAQ